MTSASPQSASNKAAPEIHLVFLLCLCSFLLSPPGFSIYKAEARWPFAHHGLQRHPPQCSDPGSTRHCGPRR
ncbi:hypothetical protein B0H11DRAFT_1850743 [Mycena galericulata]|nr:hypothetical protein B0H11DRAFT_1850743 [Mycena galericulata]